MAAQDLKVCGNCFRPMIGFYVKGDRTALVESMKKGCPLKAIRARLLAQRTESAGKDQSAIVPAKALGAIQRLLREPPATLVSAILDDSLEPIGPEAPLQQVTRYFATYNLVALPVVDESDHLLGAVTVDDVIDHMLPENWRDADAPDELDEEVTHGA